MLIIFLKAPVPGLVKTRLADAYGPEKACDIYKELTETILNSTKKWREATTLFYYPSDGKSLISDWLGEDYQMELQHGADIGERMKNAFISGFSAGEDKIVLIGTDIPDLHEEIINTAFIYLKNHDCVLGPSRDGGYYLIGFNRSGFRKEVFENINWSTESVLQETLAVILELKISVKLLEKKTDIDTPEDYINAFGNH